MSTPAIRRCTVTFTMNDCGDALTACHLNGSGVTVVSGNGTSEITLEGSIADINAYSVQRQPALESGWLEQS